MPVLKRPCLQCKEKHVKCDEKQPKCGHCVKKKLPCSRPSKKTVFRHDAAASFAQDQRWIRYKTRRFIFDNRTTATLSDEDDDLSSEDSPSRMESLASKPESTANEASPATPASSSRTNRLEDRYDILTDQASHPTPHPPLGRHDTNPLWPDHTSPLVEPRLAPPSQPTDSTGIILPPIWLNHDSREPPSSGVKAVPSQGNRTSDPVYRRFPLEDVQEACLMRYYVEEIGHWIDLCDEERHFQLVVPVRARSQPHLLNAIFAVAARHLSRLPQYKTPQGIVYHGQLLPGLDQHSAVEYTLKCIPALRRFHDTDDDEYRDSIIATAVILRQLEEIDDEDDYSEIPKQINFLAIIDAVLHTLPVQSLFGQRSLIRASYWMALRQEIYHSFTRRQAPQMGLAAEYWPTASSANRAVMHTYQVLKWRWADGTEREWNRLMGQQEYLEQDLSVVFSPIFHKPADKMKGEIFPTVWYTSNIEVTSIQQSLMAKSVLLAESPQLKSQEPSRAEWRKVENQVRLLMLDLCGMALCHSASPPAILNAAFVIQTYGDFFTDHYERQALRRVVEKYRDMHAWPSRQLTEMFG